MLYKIPYSIYSFEGKLIDEKTYQDLKTIQTSSGKLEFPEPKTYYEEHKGESLLTIISFSVFILSLPLLDAIDGTPFMIIFMLSFMFFIIMVVVSFSQFISFQKSRIQQKRFFKKVKRDIFESENYKDFTKLQKINNG